ncbi:hypothetical protein WME73_04435 [Sorangium sp. So ce302]|uniref:hypothetical protein n=1 Tax=Sorangium sp. So ce302 TaxID=3133297 RepID=UPI003F6447CD
MGHPTIYPTGVTLYDPDRSWNGYTIFQAAGLGALLIDISPYWRKPPLSLNLVYRAYRAPYAWVPQLPAPRQAPVPRLDVTTFRVPGAAPLGRDRVVELRGAQGYGAEADFCVAPTEGSEAQR